MAATKKASSLPIQVDHDRLYTDALYLPPRAFGQIEICTIPGKGRGLIATADVPPGELLIVSEPAGPLVTGLEGEMLTSGQLLDAFTPHGLITDENRARLGLLFYGDQQAPISAAEFLAVGSRASQDKAAAAAKKAVTKRKGFGSKQVEAVAPASADTVLTEATLSQVIQYNSWGEFYSDLGAAPCRNQPSQSCEGVWPEFSLLNHSCIANTLPILVGDRLIVRAARGIPKGIEVTTNYLGIDAFETVSSRQQHLEATFGFKCGCARCVVESRMHADITSQLEHMSAQLDGGAVEQQITAQIAADDTAALSEHKVRLELQVNKLEALMEEHGVQPQERVWLRASSYTTYELLAITKHTELQSVSTEDRDGSAALIATLVPIVQAVAPGSDHHLYLSCQLLEWRAQQPVGSEQRDQTSKALLAAHLTRYGRVSDAVLTKLMIARSRVGSDLLGHISLPTPWARQAAPAR